MKILLVSPYCLPHCGGIEVLVDQEARLLARQGHDVVIVCSNAGTGEEPAYPPNLRVVRVPAWNGLESRQIPWPAFSPSLLPILWRLVLWSDHVHAHGFLYLSSVTALLLAWLFARPSILTEHIGPAWFPSLWKRMLSAAAIAIVGTLCVRLAGKCWAHHERVAMVLRRMASDPAHVVYLPTPLQRTFLQPATVQDREEARQALGWSPHRSKVLFVGRLVARKGIDLLLQAKDDRFDLVFCGPGDPAILGDTRDDGVLYLPSRTRPELVSLYHAADLLAVPSRSEGNLVLVAQEALVCGLPVLLGNDPWLARYRQCAGLHFCALEATALRRRIIEILDKGRAPGEGVPFVSFLPDEDEWARRVVA